MWAWQLNHSEPFPGVESYPNEDALISNVKKALASGLEKSGRAPRVIVIGALGRCGSGAVEALRKVGVPEENIVKWDMAETAGGGPFSMSTPSCAVCLSLCVSLTRCSEEITDSDVFVNCIYLAKKIPNFGKHSFTGLNAPTHHSVAATNTTQSTTSPSRSRTASFPSCATSQLYAHPPHYPSANLFALTWPCLGHHLPLHPRPHLHRRHDLRQADGPRRGPAKRPAAVGHLDRPPAVAAAARGVRCL